MPFEYSNIFDLSGKTFIITGATSGLGEVQALHLAKHRAHVIVVGRSEKKVQEAVEMFKTQTDNQSIEGAVVDLMDMQSVVKFCDEFQSRNIPLYCLTLNAGIMGGEFRLSKDGIESQWQTNVLSQYLMCMRLLPAIQRCTEARIVIVSSRAHNRVHSRFPLTNEYINDVGQYSSFKRYAETKCANLLLTRYLSNHLKESGHENIFVNALHPGVVATDLWRNFWSPLRTALSWFITTPERGAKTQIYLSMSPEVALKQYRGEYFVPDASLSQASAVATDDFFVKELISFLNEQVKSTLESKLSS